MGDRQLVEDVGIVAVQQGDAEIGGEDVIIHLLGDAADILDVVGSPAADIGLLQCRLDDADIDAVGMLAGGAAWAGRWG